MRRRPRAPCLGRARRFAAEQQDVAAPERVVEIRRPRTRGEKDQPRGGRRCAKPRTPPRSDDAGCPPDRDSPCRRAGRRGRWSGKPAGSMMCASMPRQAARRRMVPVFWGISGSNSAMRRCGVKLAPDPVGLSYERPRRGEESSALRPLGESRLHDQARREGVPARANGTVRPENLRTGKRFMRLLVISAGPRLPHLRSLGKGANKTPLDLAAWPLACTQRLLARGERPVRPPPPGGVSVSGAGGNRAASTQASLDSLHRFGCRQRAACASWLRAD